MTTVLVLLAGGVGAVCRFVVDGAVRARWASTVPWATMGINVAGSFLLGLLAGIVASGGAGHDLQLVLGTGFCGGFTTFSTAMVETVRLAQRRRVGAAMVSGLGTLVLALAAVTSGWFLTGP